MDNNTTFETAPEMSITDTKFLDNVGKLEIEVFGTHRIEKAIGEGIEKFIGVENEEDYRREGLRIEGNKMVLLQFSTISDSKQ
jgi:hypothetical protein